MGSFKHQERHDPRKRVLSNHIGEKHSQSATKKKALSALHCHQQPKQPREIDSTHSGSPIMFSFLFRAPVLVIFFFFSFLVVYHLHCSSTHPIFSHLPTLSLNLSDGYEQLAPTAHDEYSANKEPYASNDVNVSRQLVRCENLRAQKARPRALVRVYEWAAGELCGGVIRGSGMGRRGASCHFS